MLPPNPNQGVPYDPGKLRTIYLAGGCFWGTQAYLSRLLGVAGTVCGYANGHTERPTYEQVCREHTGHAEAVEVTYDPTKISLSALLTEFFKTINPTSLNRQGGDVGKQYRTGIYYAKEQDLPIVQAVVRCVQQQNSLPVVTEVGPIENFYPAEEYHQHYLERNPGGYCHVDLSDLPPGGVAKGADDS